MRSHHTSAGARRHRDGARPGPVRRGWRGALAVGALVLGTALASGSAVLGEVEPAAADVAGCTPTGAFTDCVVVTFTNPPANQSVRVPPGVTEVDARMWGAGGGGASATPFAAAPGGGAGAFVAGTVPVTGAGGATWNVTIGWGGYAASDLRPFGDGGPGGTAQGSTPRGSAGGGTTALWGGDPGASPLLVAGAGGGGAAG
ncbi:hypothetical protein ACFVS0_06950, partial [Isoptericola sp. NPDC058082]